MRFIYLFIFFTSISIAQTNRHYRINNWGYNNYDLLFIEKKLNSPDIEFHTNSKPYTNNFTISSESDSAYQRIFSNISHLSAPESSVNDIGFDIRFNSQVGYGLNQNELMNELWINPSINYAFKNKFYVTAGALLNNSNYPSFIDSFINTSHTTPGIGTAYVPDKKQIASESYIGYLSYSPNKIFNLQIGNDKHFWGDGYRSLFLSDFAPAFPYFKTTASVWKIKYTSMFTLLKDASAANGISNDYKNKYGTFHFLSWNITRRINIGLFESIVWQGTDSNRVRGYDINYLNPVIFFRPVEYSLGSSDNALIGFSFKIKALKKQVIYGQLLLDEFLLKEVKARTGWWANKQGVQLGLRSFDVGKIDNLNLRIEGNYIRPYTYSHGSVQQSYGHLNHPLAHPLGANFIEGLGIINYRINKMNYELKITHTVYGADSAGYNMGKNIFEPYVSRPRDYGNYTTQGIKTTLTNLQANINYMVYFSKPMYLEAGVVYRIISSTIYKESTPYIYLSIKTPLWNEYRDF